MENRIVDTETFIPIDRRVKIDPKKLTRNIKKHILDNLKTSTRNECSKTYGYILEIADDELEILETTDTIMTVRFYARVLLPTIGSIMVGKISMIFKDGIFIDVQGRQKILINNAELTRKGYEFQDLSRTYIRKNNKDKTSEIIKENIDIIVKIVNARYFNGTYKCIGELV